MPTTLFNTFLAARNTFHWDKRATALAPGDYTKAHIYHWVHDRNTNSTGVAVLESEKKALENRVWYAYANQYNGGLEGDSAQPIAIARVLDDPDGVGPQVGPTQMYRYEYNAKGKVTRATDPVGRETVYEYDANGIDHLRTKQRNGSTYDLLETRTYNSQHQSLTVTDVAGQVTTYTYNTNGTLATVVTPPRAGLSVADRTTSYGYFSDNAGNGAGRLQSVTAPLGQVTSFTYDGHGRLRTTTDSDSYTLTYDYDVLDRATKVTFPDATFEETVYNRLDPEKTRDRLGRWTYTFHDALGRVASTRDPLGRTTTQTWCTCGALDKLTDANGNATTWQRDVQGRVTKEIRANLSEWIYTYESTTSRLKQVTDPKLQVKNIQYFADNRLKEVGYEHASYTTPTVSFTYDALYGRLATMTDGAGTTAFAYNAVGIPPALGAAQLASVDGPVPGGSDTITYAYDELGRRVSRTLDGQTTTFRFDALDRVEIVAHPIGDFAYGYTGPAGRLTSLRYPNGTSTTYAYFSGSLDRQLREIHHRLPGGVATLSKQTYAYDAVGNVTTWTQQGGSPEANAYDFSYDAGDQLVRGVYRTIGSTPTMRKRYGYAYDALGNRTTEQVDDAVTQGRFSNMNRLMNREPGGALTFAGSTNEPASVIVQGRLATTTSSNTFSGTAQLGSGPSTVSIAAADPSGNVSTNNYQVNVGGTVTSYIYDANGNLAQASDGTTTWTYDWYANNMLAKVAKNGLERARFVYDGLGRRHQKAVGGIVTTYVYDDDNLLREALSSGTIYDYVRGSGIDEPLARKDQSGAVIYYHADHLGSITNTTNGVGTAVTTRHYDPFGSLDTGATEGGYAFTGREWDPETDLYYYRSRYYAPTIGRFISEDVIGTGGGLNLYAYVENNPTLEIDPLGLAGSRRDWTGLRRCDGAERAGCELKCRGKGGVKSCNVLRIRKLRRFTPDAYGKGRSATKWVTEDIMPPQCLCNDDDDGGDKNKPTCSDSMAPVCVVVTTLALYLCWQDYLKNQMSKGGSSSPPVLFPPPRQTVVVVVP